MSDEPNLVSFTTTPLTSIPQESLGDFKKWVQDDGLKPSAALRKIMDKYDCPNLDSSVLFGLIEYTFPQIDISRCAFTFKINDSGYPNSNPERYSDKDFDEAIDELKSLPPGW